MIIPKFSTGANIADLAPITIFACPCFILFHSSYLSPIDNLLCNIAIFSFPNLDINLSNICGVNDISGTNTIAVFSFFIASCINCKYISVFPEPVMPYNRNFLYSSASIFSFIFSDATSCSSVNFKKSVCSTSLNFNGSL